MIKILFLDDNKARHRTMKPHLLHDEAFTAGEAIKLLQEKEYEIVFLDHDLDDKQMVSSFGEEETGYTVAKWISENKPKISLIVSHSLNSEGRANIAQLLENLGYKVIQCSFLSLESRIDNILSVVKR